jgi:vancomycin permeability regulator SanA
MSSLAQRLATTALFALLIYAGAAASIAFVGVQDHATRADIIVVPGNTVRPDGSLSARLQARLDVALQLFREGLAPTIFVSGGTGPEGRDEAAAMAAYLMAQGVAASAIVQDPQGIDTAATAVNAAHHLRAHQQQHSAIVATQYFHVARTTLALERNGVRVTGTRHAAYRELRDVYSLFREVVGYAVYWARR